MIESVNLRKFEVTIILGLPLFSIGRLQLTLIFGLWFRRKKSCLFRIWITLIFIDLNNLAEPVHYELLIWNKKWYMMRFLFWLMLKIMKQYARWFQDQFWYHLFLIEGRVFSFFHLHVMLTCFSIILIFWC